MKVFKLFENVSQHSKLNECNNNNNNNNNKDTNGTQFDARPLKGSGAVDDTIIVGDTKQMVDNRFNSIENFLTANGPNAVAAAAAAAQTMRNGLLSAQQQYPALNMLTPCLKDVLLAAQLFRGKHIPIIFSSSFFCFYSSFTRFTSPASCTTV